MTTARELVDLHRPNRVILSPIALAFLTLLSTVVLSQETPNSPPSASLKALPASNILEQGQPLRNDDSQSLQQAKRSALNRGDAALDQGDFDEAIRAFRSAIVPPVEWKDEDDTKAHRGLLAAYSGKGDMESTLYFACEISRRPKFASDLLHQAIGQCYMKLQQHTTSVDFFRLAASDSEDEMFSRQLALTLIQAPVPSLRDGKEALTWLADQRDLAEKDPRLSKLMAMAAAESGDFERALTIQRNLINRVPVKDRAAETELISQYEKKQKAKIHFPSFERTKTLSKDQLAARAWNSTVYVNVSALASDGITDDESTIVKVVKRRHMGIVLNKLGSILVSTESISLPRMVESDLSSPRAKRWVKEPLIKVWAIADESGTALELGTASILGSDFDSGLAVLQIDRPDHSYEPIAEIEPIRFQPEFRSYDPDWLAFSKTYFERIDSQLIERQGGRIEPRSYPLAIDNPQVSGTTAQFIECDNSQATIGAPLLNALGECIGLAHTIKNPRSTKVAIPSAVCCRVASKICAFGFVPRVLNPMIVSSVSQTRKTATGTESIVQSGMYVSEVRSEKPAFMDKNSSFQKLVGEVILSVDGHPTPTHTEWLTALERITFCGWQGRQLELEIIDSDWKNRRTIQLRFPPVDRH